MTNQLLDFFRMVVEDYDARISTGHNPDYGSPLRVPRSVVEAMRSSLEPRGDAQKSPNCSWCGSPGDHYSGCAFEGQPRRSAEPKMVHVAECAHGRRLEIDCRDCENETPHGCGRMISTALNRGDES